MQALGEMAEARGVAGPPVVEAITGLTRGQFLKGVGGAVVGASVLGGAAGILSPSEAAAQIRVGEVTQRTRNELIGASIARPQKWFVEREEYTYDETYGFTLWTPEEGSVEDHGGVPVVRVALAYDLNPGQIERRVRERLAAFSHLPAFKREMVPVGGSYAGSSARGRRFMGVAVGPIPGSTPSTEVYVPVEGRVYQINVYEPRLSAEGRRLLLGLSFERPSRSAEAFRSLPNGKKAETHHGKGDEELVERELAARKAGRVTIPREGTPGPRRAADLSASPFGAMGAEYRTLQATPAEGALAGAPEEETAFLAAASGDIQIAEGCWQAPYGAFFQTQHGAYANGSGWTRAGVPNYWGAYTHGSLGYGRCTSTYYTNDMYAIDYPLRKGDILFSPFAGGVVYFAGRNSTHKNYGIFVVIRADNGRYVSLSAHLASLYPGIKRGVRVTNTSIIGYAGDTGDPSIPVGDPHLHQAYYRYPRFLADGSPYGGNGLKVVYHRYTGTTAKKLGYTVYPNPYYNVYTFGWKATSTTKAKYSWVSN